LTYDFFSILLSPLLFLMRMGVIERLGGHMVSSQGQPTTDCHKSTSTEILEKRLTDRNYHKMKVYSFLKL